MPIYAYRCTRCGHAQDVLRKVSDPPLSDCPACGADSFVKQVTAAGFQLKGSGWYVTDFRGGNNGGAAKKDGEGAAAEKDAAKPAEKAPEVAGPSPATGPAPAPAAASSAPSSAASPPPAAS